MSDSGPLRGLSILEIQGIGPAPFCGMLLSDLGADVIRVDRPGQVGGGAPPLAGFDVLSRGRRSICIDLKNADGAAVLLDLADQADVLIEGLRPGVMERLGVGPDACLARNPRLVYGRMTGYGQDGPMADAAGHDINYIAVSGALWPIGRGGQAPVPPLNLVGDFGGGGMLLAVGVLAALLERSTSGRGQVIDAAMVDGSAVLNSFLYGLHAAGGWAGDRGANLLDSGAPFYEVYETADGKWVSVGAIEPQFYAALVERLGVDVDLNAQLTRGEWPATKAKFAAAFKARTRDDWEQHFAGSEACVVPVLSPWEAPLHPHAQARGGFTEAFGIVQPSAAPRFGRTPGSVGGAPPTAGQHTEEILTAAGFDADRIAQLRASGAIA